MQSEQIKPDLVQLHFVRLYLILFDWFDWPNNPTHTKLDVQLCSIAIYSQTPILRLRLSEIIPVMNMFLKMGLNTF